MMSRVQLVADIVKAMSITLNTGAKMPLLGLGTWQSAPGKVESAVEAALKAGYRLVDCAEEYENEAEIGMALQKCFKEGLVKREDVFVTSKLWSSNHEPKDLMGSFHSTLKNLQLQYLDLYLIHWPASVKKDAPWPYPEEDKLGYRPEVIARCWQELEQLVSKGLVKAIGVSNFTITKTENLLKTAKIVPAVNQVECHPYFQQPKLKAYCDHRGIVLEAYSPLGNPGRPDKESGEPEVLEDATLKRIASKHESSAVQVCLAFGMQRGIVVIPKTVSPARLGENIAAKRLTLDDSDMEAIRKLGIEFRLYKAEYFLKNGEKWENFWDVKADEDFIVE